MCAHRCHGVGSQPRADIYNRTSAVFGLAYYETALRRFYFGVTAGNDNFMAKMEKMLFFIRKK